jgi:hypothetical protein
MFKIQKDDRNENFIHTEQLIPRKDKTRPRKIKNVYLLSDTFFKWNSLLLTPL